MSATNDLDHAFYHSLFGSPAYDIVSLALQNQERERAPA